MEFHVVDGGVKELDYDSGYSELLPCWYHSPCIGDMREEL